MPLLVLAWLLQQFSNCNSVSFAVVQLLLCKVTTEYWHMVKSALLSSVGRQELLSAFFFTTPTT